MPADALDDRVKGGVANGGPEGDIEGSVGEELVCELPDADPNLPDIPKPEEVDECGRPAGRFRKVAGVAVPLLIGVAALATVIGLFGGSRSMIDALRSVRLGAIGLALLAEVASYGLLGLHLRLLGGPNPNVRRLAPFRIATVVFGLGSVMPAAPAEGMVMAGAVLRRRRLARRRTVLVLGISQVFGTTGLYALFAIDAIAVVISAHDGPLGASGFLIGGGIGALGVLVVLGVLLTSRTFAQIGGLIAGRIRHIRHPAPKEERRERGLAWHNAAMHILIEERKAPWLIATMIVAWALDGGAMYFALAAVGVRVNFDVLLLAYSASAAASAIPLLPAGLGVVETVTPAILSLYGVPLAAGLTGLLVYRAIGTFLPALAGACSLATLRYLKAPTPTPEEAAA